MKSASPYLPENRDPLTSLLVVSLPRSLSTFVYHVCALATGLKEPVWTSDGEVLNVDRFIFFPGPTHDTGLKFIHPRTAPALFSGTYAFLDAVIARTGYAYKDVVQPFLLARWCATNPINVLYNRRNIADVAYSMVRVQWFYPAEVATYVQDRDMALVTGLILADRALNAIAIESIEFDALVSDETVISSKLQSLYPNTDIPQFRYIHGDFLQSRNHIMERRNTDEYKRLQDKCVRATEALYTDPGSQY